MNCELAALAADQLGLKARDVCLSRIRTGKHNESCWVEAAGRRWVLRIAPADETGLLFYERRMMRQEPALHALIRERTTIPVAEIVAADFTRTKLDRDYLLMTALPGRPMSEARLGGAEVATVLRQTGEHLRQLHSITAEAFGYLGAHRPMEPQPTWTAAFELMWNKLVDDVVACGCYSGVEANGLRRALDRHRAVFDRDVAASLLHMDVWAQNILVDAQGRVTGLVDLDRALWGDPEIEFAVLDYCGISDPPFWDGYGAERDRSSEAETRRIFYLLYELQKYMPISVWRRRDPARAAAYKRECLRLAAALG
ncbi:MAG TPA: aminoglycoside phosphotransferase family protein [Bryobacteraceae bacterium]|nr:aminoglycoside phosphotransferase family protein [Bryobacteraceae bacterium]